MPISRKSIINSIVAMSSGGATYDRSRANYSDDVELKNEVEIFFGQNYPHLYQSLSFDLQQKYYLAYKNALEKAQGKRDFNEDSFKKAFFEELNKIRSQQLQEELLHLKQYKKNLPKELHPLIDLNVSLRRNTGLITRETGIALRQLQRDLLAVVAPPLPSNSDQEIQNILKKAHKNSALKAFHSEIEKYHSNIAITGAKEALEGLQDGPLKAEGLKILGVLNRGVYAWGMTTISRDYQIKAANLIAKIAKGDVGEIEQKDFNEITNSALRARVEKFAIQAAKEKLNKTLEEKLSGFSPDQQRYFKWLAEIINNPSTKISAAQRIQAMNALNEFIKNPSSDVAQQKCYDVMCQSMEEHRKNRSFAGVMGLGFAGLACVGLAVGLSFVPGVNIIIIAVAIVAAAAALASLFFASKHLWKADVASKDNLDTNILHHSDQAVKPTLGRAGRSWANMEDAPGGISNACDQACKAIRAIPTAVKNMGESLLGRLNNTDNAARSAVDRSSDSADQDTNQSVPRSFNV